MIDPAFLIALAALTTAAGTLIALIQSGKKGRADSSNVSAGISNSAQTILLTGFQELADKRGDFQDEAEQKLGASILKLFDCEKREQKLTGKVNGLEDKIEALERKVAQLEGAS